MARFGHAEYGWSQTASRWKSVLPRSHGPTSIRSIQGTRHVMSNGCRILHDPQGMLRRLCSAVRQAEQR